ncbi:MAG: hypothetical protein SYR96_13490, partial [Actinomycetota bacterium]|nr:hypothetical protein [Actinomycetota bacterium]
AFSPASAARTDPSPPIRGRRSAQGGGPNIHVAAGRWCTAVAFQVTVGWLPTGARNGPVITDHRAADG